MRSLYDLDGAIPLHTPSLSGNEQKYVAQALESTFVSSVGEFVNRFERDFAKTVGAKYAVAVTNGTAALHLSLRLAGVGADDEVITQPLTFVATCNAISYLSAHPVFVDVDRDSLGLSPEALCEFLETHAYRDGEITRNRLTGRRIQACLPMHSFGHLARISEIVALCRDWNITVVEDAAEALGSKLASGEHAGTIGKLGIFSFNGNKIITAGGGGIITSNDAELAGRAKHLSTTAKLNHAWEFAHDEYAYNYRMPNLNAALVLAQLEQLHTFLNKKRKLAQIYAEYCDDHDIQFVRERAGTVSNYWLNAILCSSQQQRDSFLEYSNSQGVRTRPAWNLMTDLPMYKNCEAATQTNARWVAQRLVNLPSGVAGLRLNA